MYCKIKSAANIGLTGYLVEVEVHIARGLPRLKIVGLPGKTVEEAKERIVAAIKSSGYTFPLKRITINLAPSSIHKHGLSFDLPMAIGIIIASKQAVFASKELQSGSAFCGELSLDGSLRDTNGMPIFVQTAMDHGLKKIVTPEIPIDAELFPKIKILQEKSLRTCLLSIEGKKKFKVRIARKKGRTSRSKPTAQTIFSSIRGNETAKRVATIAAAGHHHLSLSGPPGCGKTLLAQTIPEILPPPSQRELLEIQKIYSLKGEKAPASRPFRSPHHTASQTTILGGGQIPYPGEISLAHKGILFLDELADFSRGVLTSLRQPLDSREITIYRSKISATFPCQTILVTAMNLCPCGYLGHPSKKCKCNSHQLAQYQNKVPGSLWDRIDLHTFVSSQKFADLTTKSTTHSTANNYHNQKEVSKTLKNIQTAHEIQRRRGLFNSRITLQETDKLCPRTPAAQKLLEMSYKKLGLSTRGLLQTIRVARTIADLDYRDCPKNHQTGNPAESPLTEAHVAEALSYRRHSLLT